MKLTVHRASFAEVVIAAAKAVPRNPTAPVLGGILLTADQPGLSARAYDFETSVYAATEATTHDPGCALVSARLLVAVAKALRASRVDLVTDDRKLTVTAGTAVYTLPLLDASTFPKMPDPPESVGSVSAALLRSAVADVVPATAVNSTAHPELEGVFLELEESAMTLTASDTRRCARRRITWTPAADGSAPTLVPAVKLTEMASLITDDSCQVLTEGGSTIGFSDQTRSATTRVVDGKFPNMDSHLAAAPSTLVTVNTSDLLAVVTGVASVSTAQVVVVRLDWSDGAGGVSVVHEEASGSEHLEASIKGPAISAACNAAYLTEALRTFDAERVRIGYTKQNHPIIITPDMDEGGHWHMIAAMRIPGES